MMSLFARLFKKQSAARQKQPAQVFFTNTLSGNKELFIPQKPGLVTMYTCGPTVYGPVHIGNLRAFWLPDMIARALEGAGYRVRRVLNITDFGHLVTDGDAGEDKMTKGLKREGLDLTLENMRAMAERYTATFIDELAELNVPVEDVTFPRASDYIPEQIAFISTLEQKGYAYRTKEGVYYDTARFPGYGQLGGIEVSNQKEGTRAKENTEKRNPADFVLWKPDPKIGWESPWGRGFPGWHIECAAMIRSLLGQEIDIHTGGEDLIPVHHNNEIAESEAASGRTFTHYWLHNAFLTMGGEKASKSVGNVVYMPELLERGIHPLALRYFFLQAHYRTPLSFSWEALQGAAQALERLRRLALDTAQEAKKKGESGELRGRFLAHLRDDLATPQALGLLWEALKSDEYTPEEKWDLLETADAHLGLELCIEEESVKVPTEVLELVEKREKARLNKDFAEADRLRSEIANRGYHVDDGLKGPVLTKRTL